MKPEREQTEKKNAERYLVVTKNAMPMTIWAESFAEGGELRGPAGRAAAE